VAVRGGEDYFINGISVGKILKNLKEEYRSQYDQWVNEENNGFYRI